jgi:excisionase family DNA binding protein
MSTAHSVAEPQLTTPYLTAEEAADYLRFSSVAWFRRAVRKYGIPCLRRGRRMFFTQANLDQFMAVASEATGGGRKATRQRKAH